MGRNPSDSPTRPRRGTAIRGTHGWDEAMVHAYNQAERYAKALPTSEGWPPFLITVDVGHSIERFADFSLTGKAYLPFPDPRTYRILLPQLAQPELAARLRAVWLDPHSPSRNRPAKPYASPARPRQARHPRRNLETSTTRASPSSSPAALHLRLQLTVCKDKSREEQS